MVKSNEFKVKDQVPEGAGVPEKSSAETQIEKFIFRGSELVSFQVAGKIVSLDELIAMGNNFVYKETNDKGEEISHKIIVTDLGKGKYLSTKEKGENIERTFARLI